MTQYHGVSKLHRKRIYFGSQVWRYKFEVLHLVTSFLTVSQESTGHHVVRDVCALCLETLCVGVCVFILVLLPVKPPLIQSLPPFPWPFIILITPQRPASKFLGWIKSLLLRLYCSAEFQGTAFSLKATAYKNSSPLMSSVVSESLLHLR